jgi:ADP-ribose pyrophosphatase YjhB (NUDIX family)
MNNKIFEKNERRAIFELFLEKKKLRFSSIQKKVNLRSNHLTYHLKVMVNNNILEKKDDFYYITNDAQKYIPLFSNIIGEKLSPLPVALVCLINNNKVLLIKRNNRPYKNYWGMIGGRILHDEIAKDASLRLVKKKAGIENCEFVRVCDIVDEKVYDNDVLTNSFILYFCMVKSNVEDFEDKGYGKLMWFYINKLDELNIIPSDLWLIKNCLNKKFESKKVVMKSKDDRLNEFRVER